MIELLYGQHPSVRRNGPKITLNISKLSQKLNLRPVRLLECLEWLRSQLMISELQIGRYEASLRLKAPRGFESKEVIGEPSLAQNNTKGWLQ